MCSFVVVCRFTLAHNVQQLCDGAAIEARQPKLAQKLNSSTIVEPMTVSRTIAKLPVGCWHILRKVAI